MRSLICSACDENAPVQFLATPKLTREPCKGLEKGLCTFEVEGICIIKIELQAGPDRARGSGCDGHHREGQMRPADICLDASLTHRSTAGSFQHGLHERRELRHEKTTLHIAALGTHL